MKQKTLVAGFAVAAALTLSGCSMFYPNPVPTQTETPTPTPTETPTETPTPTPTVDPALEQVEVTIVMASGHRENGEIEVIATADGILEDTGKCTLILTQGKVRQTVTVDAEPNVNSTQCFPMHLPFTGIQDGAASYTVTYESEKYGGVSEAGEIQIK